MKRKLILTLTLLALLLPHTGSALARSAADAHIPFVADQSQWLDAVCETMTAGGCAYFSAHQAEVVWLALKNADSDGADLHFQRKISDLHGGFSLWQIDLRVSLPGGETSSHTLYATVSTQEMRLDRVVVFDNVLLGE